MHICITGIGSQAVESEYHYFFSNDHFRFISNLAQWLRAWIETTEERADSIWIRQTNEYQCLHHVLRFKKSGHKKKIVFFFVKNLPIEKSIKCQTDSMVLSIKFVQQPTHNYNSIYIQYVCSLLSNSSLVLFPRGELINTQIKIEK